MTRFAPDPSLSPDDRALALAAGDPQFRAWLDQMARVGGCANPVYLTGHTITRDAGSGLVVGVFTSRSQPRGLLAVACGNRRASRCEPCSRLHRGDTYQLVVSGLVGGKSVPESVRGHPRLFVTLTAPSFGAVHRVADLRDPGARCRPRRDAAVCAHGARSECAGRHADVDAVVGSPLCPGCYGYERAVLWNARAGRLWSRYTDQVRRILASRAGVARARLSGVVRVSFAKVAEFQRRGSVHFHAVIRLDGPDGPDCAPPS
ncbi:MAG: replication initiator, partial [Sciscionella sp.]